MPRSSIPVPDDPRAAKYALERIQDLLRHLNLAKIALQETGFDPSAIDGPLDDARVQAERLEAATYGKVESRRKFKHVARSTTDPIPEYYLFLDECGSHVTAPIDQRFPVFALSGVVVNRASYSAFDILWKAWKATNLGGPDRLVHEPAVRTCTGNFSRATEEEKRALTDSLSAALRALDFRVIAAVVDLNRFAAQYADGRVDDFLPKSMYLMAIDFVMERFVHFLQYAGGDARGLVIAESRGARDDAVVHAEFIRLQLQGTQYLSQSDFRWQLRPFIEFYRKTRNSSGLEVADLSARPLADKVLNPQSSPPRWDVFSEKLYDGGKGHPHRYGLKIFPVVPANDPFPNLPRKASGDA